MRLYVGQSMQFLLLGFVLGSLFGYWLRKKVRR